MKLDDCLRILTQHYRGLQLVNAWGETSLFYNPEGYFPRGTYCFTFKIKDGENDSSSNLNRDGIDYRLNFKVLSATYMKLFDEPRLPKRPPKGGIIVPESGRTYDPTALNQLMPHPVYGWMGWVSIINPDEIKFQDFLTNGLMDEAYEDARKRYQKLPSVRAKHGKRLSNELSSSYTAIEILLPKKRAPRPSKK